MNWRTLAFSFRGRLNRAKYWLVLLIGMVVSAICIGVEASLIPGLQMGIYGSPGGIMAVIGLTTIVLLFVLWSSLAIGCKRLHDRNKSAVWLLLFWLAPSVLYAIGQSIGANGAGAFVALVGAAIAVWGLVEIGFLKGTDGPNDFGPDPLSA
jgi:uncharacterized membrane protein YhaH (DUF805 family)